MAAKIKRRALKARKDIYEKEKMTLLDAIAVLRVRPFIEEQVCGRSSPFFCLQAVEVSSPNSTYELVVKTEMKTGVAIPKGRVSLPRDAKPKTDDKILVFAEGRQADEAKKAGAHVVGGPELVDAVRLPIPSLLASHQGSEQVFLSTRSSIINTTLPQYYAHQLLSAQ